jgi:NADH:ubiquinone oxidoreductase subunit 3 (subunit A)
VRLPFSDLLDSYLAVFIGTIVGFFLVATALIAARVLAPFSKERGKAISYECGMLPIGRVRARIDIRYYIFAILFVIFDVEAVFLFPWAATFSAAGKTAFWEMVLFIGILGAGLGYAWKKGVLQWNK